MKRPKEFLRKLERLKVKDAEEDPIRREHPEEEEKLTLEDCSLREKTVVRNGKMTKFKN